MPRALISVLWLGTRVVLTGRISASVEKLNCEGDAFTVSWAVNSLFVLEVEQMSCCTCCSNSQSGLKHYLCNVIICGTRTWSMRVTAKLFATQIITMKWHKLISKTFWKIKGKFKNVFAFWRCSKYLITRLKTTGCNSYDLILIGEESFFYAI